MSIRLKIALLVVAALTGCWLLVTYLSSRDISKQVNELEKIDITRQVLRVQQQIGFWQKDTELLCSEWVDHLRVPPNDDLEQPVWLKEHLGAALELRGMQFAAVYTDAGKQSFMLQRLAGGKARDDGTKQRIQIVSSISELALQVKETTSGLLYSPDGLVIFAIQKIPAGGKLEGQTFILAMVIDEARLKELKDSLQVNAQVLPVGPDSVTKLLQKYAGKSTEKRPWARSLTDTTIGGYSILRDPAGQPVGIIEVTQSCRLKQNLQTSMSQLSAEVAGVSVVVAIFLLLMIDITVTRRIRKLALAMRDASPDDLKALPRSLYRSHDEVGSLARVTKIMVDQLRDSQSRYRAVVETQTELIVRCKPDGELTFVNDAFADFFGGSLASFNDRNYFALLPEALRDSERQLMGTLTRRNRTLKREISLTSTDGNLHWLEWHQRAILDEDKKVVEIQCVGWDITDRREFQDKLELAKEEAEKANHAKSEFLAVISHEIRTPLNSIMGYSTLVQQLVTEDQSRDCLQQIEDSGRLLLRIFDDIFEYASMDSQKQNLKNETEFLVRDCVLVSTSQSKRNAEQKGLRFDVEIAADIPETIISESQRLQRCLSILTSNSVKFTEHGGIRVSVSLLPGDPASEIRSMVFEVSDSGIGISPEMKDQIFTPFLQVDSSTTRIYGGLGLGLAFCKRVVALMDGEITVESELGKGSSFRIVLPVRIPARMESVV
ncbi:MAG: ATP-binding protein [Chthoniobacterales bacterium]